MAVGTPLHGEMQFFRLKDCPDIILLFWYFILLSSSSPRSRADGFYSDLIGPGGLSEIGGHFTTMCSVKYDKKVEET